ncbi:YdeI/OmpD-associated family protein [Catenuloplanes japonicus]|uniref:YdeI/OmpD-associated family protein n=1 Tax=Catenuloplanes japonicus TaxID=33876 RepID=UPI0005253025|nr:YdeI/OmpD-associated family protein [Catenuloplanes japonicus]
MEFTTELLLSGKSATGLRVPDEVMAGLGAGKKPPVSVTINGYTYRSTVGVMGGVPMIPVSAEHRKGAGITAGESVTVTVVLDDAPREVEVPDDLAAALAGAPSARKAFEALSYSRKKALVLPVTDAKSAETRARRVAKVIETLAG